MRRIWIMYLFVFCIINIAACVGSPVHKTMTYNRIQADIKRNNKNLLSMKIGLSQEQTIEQMGEPEKSEGYTWGSAWFYRTAMTSAIYETSDADYTPIVFEKDGKVVGWGRNFYTDVRKRYEIDINVK